MSADYYASALKIMGGVQTTTATVVSRSVLFQHNPDLFVQANYHTARVIKERQINAKQQTIPERNKIKQNIRCFFFLIVERDIESYTVRYTYIQRDIYRHIYIYDMMS